MKIERAFVKTEKKSFVHSRREKKWGIYYALCDIAGQVIIDDARALKCN